MTHLSRLSRLALGLIGGCGVFACVLAAAPLSRAQAQSQPEPRRPPIVHAVDLLVASPPASVVVAGRRVLAYELHITNFRPSDIALTRVEVLDGVRGERLGDFRDAAIGDRLGRPGAPPDLADKRTIASGLRAVMYFWLALDDGAAMPSRIRHRIEMEIVRASGRERAIVEDGGVDVRNTSVLVLDPPLRGGPWVALYDPMMVGGHRTTIYAVEGRARIPARFAVDFVKLDDEGMRARGDASLIANWHGYGAEVLAVADATVVEAMDDIAEAPTLPKGKHAPVPLENASGNYICLDLGAGRYAFYEHLQHRSVRVKAGDRVTRGDVIARLGNSGSSSSGPHLHFHVADGKSELASEGLPYVFRTFDVLGAYDTIDDADNGNRWKPAPAASSGTRRTELPGPSVVITFPARDRERERQ